MKPTSLFLIIAMMPPALSGGSIAFDNQLDNLRKTFIGLVEKQHKSAEADPDLMAEVQKALSNLEDFLISGYEEEHIDAAKAGLILGNGYIFLAELTKNAGDFQTAGDLMDQGLKYLGGTSMEPLLVIDKAYFFYKHDLRITLNILLSYQKERYFFSGTLEKQRNDGQLILVIANLHEKLGHFEEAITNYESYLKWAVNYPYVAQQDLQGPLKRYKQLLSENELAPSIHPKDLPTLNKYPMYALYTDEDQKQIDDANQQAISENFKRVLSDAP